ncbi:MAG: hypothetical protein ACT4QF_20840 [Sporichthyaceae bacterium]
MTAQPMLFPARGSVWRTEAAELLLLFLDVTAERVVVGMAQLPDNDVPGPMLELWDGHGMRLDDDLGTAYEFAGARHLDHQVTETYFRPGPPPEAGRLALRIQIAGAEPSEVDVDLTAGTWFGYLGRTKRLDAPRFVSVVALLADLSDGPAILTGLILHPTWTTARVHRPGPRSSEPALPGEPGWQPTRRVPRLFIADDHGGSCGEETTGTGGGRWESSRDVYLGAEFGVHADAEALAIRLKPPGGEPGPELAVRIR